MKCEFFPNLGGVIIAHMADPADFITFSLPREVAMEIVTMSGELTDRLHELLERNTEGALVATERAELEIACANCGVWTGRVGGG